MITVSLPFEPEFAEDNLARVARISTGRFESEKPWRETVRACFNRRHLSIFEFATLTFKINAPIYVARQLMRYRNASYIERSLRYCLPAEYHNEYNSVIIDTHCAAAWDAYQAMLDNGDKREAARSVMPLATMTEWLMKVDLRELFHIFDERLTDHAQRETRDTVEKMKECAKTVYPFSISLWEEAQ